MSKTRIVFYIISLICGFLAAKYLYPFISGKDNTLSIIATIFSVLAGFLLAILTIISDPSILKGKPKKYLDSHKVEVSRVVLRHSLLFYMYILTLTLVFIVSFLPTFQTPLLQEISIWTERIMVFFVTTSFVLSLGLPQSLVNIQTSRLEQIMD